MFDSKTKVLIIVGILTFVAIFLSAYFYTTMQSADPTPAYLNATTVLAIVNGVATAALAAVAYVNMNESKKVRSEMVRPHLSLEPSFFEYDSVGEIVGFNCLNLVNGGTVARDVEIDISVKEKSSLFYACSIGTSERVQVWNGKPDQLGGNVIVAVKYKNIFNKSLQEVLSINIDSLNATKRKFAPIHKS
ncbi:MAG TPA: hypothetical protein VEF91_08145 [Verrucomicrobiae bacterium]|nr:hypothetical protein [Verrucomicrobiae bacterium]